MDRVPSWLYPLVPVLLMVCLYSGALRAGFAFDDPMAVVDNPLIDGSRSLVDAFTSDFWGDRPGYAHMASWRPLTLLSLRLDHGLGGGAPWMFHLTNVLLHAMVVLAVMGLVAALALGRWAALIAGVTVALHPVFAEGVMSIVGRGDLLAALFGLVGVRAIRRHVPLACAALLLALFAKETAVVYVAAACVWVLADRAWRRAAVLVALIAAWYALRSAVVGTLSGDVLALDNPLVALSFGDRLVAGLGVIGRYVSWWVMPQFVPADLAAGVEHAGSLSLLGGAAIAGGLGLLYVTWRRANPALVGLGLAMTSLVLLSNITFVLPTPMAGRLAYHPALGMTLAVVPLLARALARASTTRSLTLGVLAIWWVLALVPTLSAVGAWQDDTALFEASVAAEPDSARSRTNLARLRLDAGDTQGAEGHLRAALARAPDHPGALLHLALALEALGQRDEAWQVAQRAAAVEMRAGSALNNLCALGLSRPTLDDDQLLVWCRRAAKAMPALTVPAVNLARALARSGRGDEAEQVFVAAAKRDPDSTELLGQRIGFMATRGRLEEAVALQRRVLALRPRDPEALRNLVALLMQHAAALHGAGDLDRACTLATEAASRVPGVAAVAARARALCP